MNFVCTNRYCKERDEKTGLMENYRFKAKPTVDERSQCPKCERWCHKVGHSFKDVAIREIDTLMTRHQGKPLSEWHYKHLSNYTTDRLKELINEVKLAFGVIDYDSV